MNSDNMLTCECMANGWHPLCPCLDSCGLHLHQISQELFIFKMCADPLLSPRGKNVTFVHFSRKIFFRSCTDSERKGCSLGCYHNSRFVSGFLTVITSCLHSWLQYEQESNPMPSTHISLFSSREFKLIVEFVLRRCVILSWPLHISRTVSFLAQ